MRTRLNILISTIAILALSQSVFCITTQASQRRIAVGQKIPEFSATDINGKSFSYRYNNGKVTIVAFLSDGQQGSTRAAEDIKGIVKDLGANAKKLQIVIIVEDPNGARFQSIQEGQAAELHVLLDPKYQLWGKFGIIATPTVIISDINDVVLSVQSGHGYDFVPVERSHLNQALGIAQDTAIKDRTEVKTVINDTIIARVQRHLQMAKMLEQKGRIESAIAEVRTAQKLDPNSTEVTLELGELLCMANESKAALDAIKNIKTSKKVELARIQLITGWARRQLNELDAAEKLLTEATTTNPQSTRALFELGKVYQAKGQTDKAMESYFKALSMIFKESKEIKTTVNEKNTDINSQK